MSATKKGRTSTTSTTLSKAIYFVFMLAMLARCQAKKGKDKDKADIETEGGRGPPERGSPELPAYNGTFDLPPQAPYSGPEDLSGGCAVADGNLRRLGTLEYYSLEVSGVSPGDRIYIYHRARPGAVWQCGPMADVSGSIFSRHFTLRPTTNSPFVCYLDGVDVSSTRNYVDVQVYTQQDKIVDFVLGTSRTGNIELDWDYMDHDRQITSMITKQGRGLVQALCESTSSTSLCFSYFESNQALPTVDTDMTVEGFNDLQDALFGAGYDGDRRTQVFVAGITVAIAVAESSVVIECAAGVAAAIEGASVARISAGVYRVTRTAASTVTNRAWRFNIPLVENVASRVSIRSIGDNFTRVSARTTARVRNIVGGLATRWRLVREANGSTSYVASAQRRWARQGAITVDLRAYTADDLFNVVLERISYGEI